MLAENRTKKKWCKKINFSRENFNNMNFFLNTRRWCDKLSFENFLLNLLDILFNSSIILGENFSKVLLHRKTKNVVRKSKRFTYPSSVHQNLSDVPSTILVRFVSSWFSSSWARKVSLLKCSLSRTKRLSTMKKKTLNLRHLEAFHEAVKN